jgi:hypothetical protein
MNFPATAQTGALHRNCIAISHPSGSKIVIKNIRINISSIVPCNRAAFDFYCGLPFKGSTCSGFEKDVRDVGGKRKDIGKDE